MAGVKMFDPIEGEVVQVHQDDVEKAQEAGLTIETDETAKLRAYKSEAGAGELLKAGAEGVASGVTLGAYDVAAAELGGEEYTERRRMRSDTFKGIETAGQVAGTILPALLSGGSGAVARAASLAPSSIAARAAIGAERLVGRGLARVGAPLAERGIARSAMDAAARLGVGGAVEGGAAGAGFAPCGSSAGGAMAARRARRPG
jgi:hypothetical protein